MADASETQSKEASKNTNSKNTNLGAACFRCRGFRQAFDNIFQLRGGVLFVPHTAFVSHSGTHAIARNQLVLDASAEESHVLIRRQHPR